MVSVFPYALLISFEQRGYSEVEKRIFQQVGRAGSESLAACQEKVLESQRIQVIRMLFLVRKGAVLERGLHPFALCGCTACLPGLNLSHHFLKLFFCRQVDHSDGGEVNINLNMPLAINFL